MIYLKTLDTTTGIEREKLLYCWGDVHTALFSPSVERVALIEFKTHGKTYAERQENLRRLGADFREMLVSAPLVNGLKWSEYAKIAEFLKTNGARLGLMREFHENGIC